MTIEELARNVAARMRAIDSHITTSAYRPLKPGEQTSAPRAMISICSGTRCSTSSAALGSISAA